MDIFPSYQAVGVFDEANSQPYGRPSAGNKMVSLTSTQVRKSKDKNTHKLHLDTSLKTLKPKTRHLSIDKLGSISSPSTAQSDDDSTLSRTNAGSQQDTHDENEVLLTGKNTTLARNSCIHPFVRLGRKLKDRVWNSTHEERLQLRRQRAEEKERKIRWEHSVRTAMSSALETGEPQFLHTDDNGMEVYIEPPSYKPSETLPHRITARNRDHPDSPYRNPNAKFVRPKYCYDYIYGYETVEAYGVVISTGLYSEANWGMAVMAGLPF